MRLYESRSNDFLTRAIHLDHAALEPRARRKTINKHSCFSIRYKRFATDPQAYYRKQAQSPPTVHEAVLQRGKRIPWSSTPRAAMVAQCRALGPTAASSITQRRAPYIDMHDFFQQLRALQRVDVAVFLIAQRNVVELVRLVGGHERDGLDQLVERLEQDRVIRQCLHVGAEVRDVH